MQRLAGMRSGAYPSSISGSFVSSGAFSTKPGQHQSLFGHRVLSFPAVSRSPQELGESADRGDPGGLDPESFRNPNSLIGRKISLITCSNSGGRWIRTSGSAREEIKKSRY